ncbi:MAG: hypothetical protein ABIB41_11370 [Nitrospirota bacterium]
MMKKIIFIVTILAFVSVIFCIVTPRASAATEEEINIAIDNGLAWFASVQDSYGSDIGAWHYVTPPPEYPEYLYTDVTLTALVVLKFVERAKKQNIDPFSPSYQYVSNVTAGYDFLFNNAFVENDRIYFTHNATTYSTGAAMMAVAASNSPTRVITTEPLTGKTYQEVLQGMMNWMEYVQQKSNDKCDEGGWDYFEDIDDMNRWADQTNTGYATLGIGFASAPSPAGFGITIPDDVLTRLNKYIEKVQDPMDGDTYDGGSWFEPCRKLKRVNILKTGNLLYEMALVGDNLDSERVQNAISYIQNHWNDEGVQSEAAQNSVYASMGWKDSYQAMFTMTKGLEKFGIGSLNIGGSNINWFENVSNLIVTNQNENGSFEQLNPAIWEGEDSTTLRTAWALLTLGADIPEVTKSVPVDIKPYSCPNPLDVKKYSHKKYGVLHVAILGTKDFDVTQIDPASIRLEGVAPLRWSFKDVATPFTPSTGKEHCYEDCTSEGADGFKDLTLKFSAKKLIAALGNVTDNECRVLKLSGNLKKEKGSTPIVGEDVVVIQKKGTCKWSLTKKWWHRTRFR